ncbi:MAG TPA: hypothetical protein VHH73_13580 [Verrucomicrobiae bacterium]|nr:hypothetical protein [Verrucomicrobiae bacterium]
MLDTDKDARVGVQEIRSAVKWTLARLKDPGGIFAGAPSLPLAAINEATPEGKAILAAARQILRNLGKPDAREITLEDTADTSKIFAQTKFNGDGVVPPESAPDDGTRAVIADTVACLGGEPDRCGRPGVGQARVDQFFTEAQAFSDWWKKAGDTAATTLFLADATGPAYAAIQAVRRKVDDYFVRCRFAAFDSRAVTPLNRVESELIPLGQKEFSADGKEAADFPLSHVEASKPLPLLEKVNPAWAAALAKLHADAVTPVWGADKTTLTESDWQALLAKFAPYEAWLAAKAGAPVEKLGLARVREILAGGARATITTLIAEDKGLEAEANGIVDVERLIRYHRDLAQLLNNFVSFTDFYDSRRWAIFQAGTLYLDGRSCELCVRVNDPARHGSLANLARTYLAYCDCTRKSTGEKIVIAAAFTDGDSDDLLAGRNGLFYDRQGNEWEATISKLVEHPISIRQAFWSPYKRIGRMVEDQIEKFASARDQAVTANAAVSLTAPAPPAAPKKVDAGVLAALGIVTTGVVSAISTIAAPLLGMAWWKWPFVVAALVLAVSLPSMVMAALKLRKRNLGPLLDANGWAVNSKVKLNIPFGGSLTKVAKLPPNSQRDLVDPYAESNDPGKQLIAAGVLVVVLFAVWYFGLAHKFFPGIPNPDYLQKAEKAAVSATATTAPAK